MTDELEKAKQKGLLILGYGAYSASAVKSKLRARGFSEEIAEAAVEYLIEKKYIDEKRDATRLCESLVKKKYGKRRILSAISAKGYGEEALFAAEEFLETVDFVELCREAIKVKLRQIPEDRSEMQKAIAKLVALGYNVSEIKSAFRG